jgi:hypothetical protein
MVLWPFLRSDESERLDRETTLLAGMIGLSTAGIVLYVAGQWTNYSLAWDAPWPESTWIMGNNGRYASMLMVPAFWLIMRLRQVNGDDLPSLESPRPRAKALMVGIILILPISMLVAFHGQTIWTEEPAEVISYNIDDGEDFLFISDATMGMHWLYTFHLEIDPYNERNVTGHWRSPDSGWQDELVSEEKMENRGNLSNVQWIVFAPGTYWTDGYLDDWNMTLLGSSDFMNGGGNWEIWSTHVPEQETIPFD